MKTYPHAPDESVFQDNLTAASSRLVTHDTLTPALLAKHGGRFLPLNARWGLECGYQAHALGQGRQRVLGFFCEASASFQKALETNAPINLLEVITHLSLALVLRDEALTGALCALPRARYTSPDMEFPESMFMAKQVQADLASQRVDSAARGLERALRALSSDTLPRVARENIEPSLLIEKAIIEHDPRGLDRAFQARHESYARRFSNPRIRNLPEGALDLWGLGLARLALARGLSPGFESVYLPLDLLAS